MNPLITNYFDAEAAIVARLREVVEAVPAPNVLTPFDVAGMIESSQPSPSLHVIYSGDSVSPSASGGQGAVQTIDQQWLVILAVRSAAAQRQNTQSLRGVAGAIVPAVLGALKGWAPVPWMRPLVRITGPRAGYTPAFGYFPFMFEGRIVT